MKLITIRAEERDSDIIIKDAQPTFQPGDESRQGSFSVLETLWHDLQFQQYSNMYDQYRVSGVRAQFELVGGPGAGTGSIPAVYAFATALDRNGVTLLSGQDLNITSQEMRGMSSYLPATYYSGSKFRSVRQFFPSTMLERSQYLPTSAAVSNAGELPGFVGPDAAAFNPWMYFQVSNLVTTSQQPQTFTIVVNFDVAVTFRALRLNNRNWLAPGPNPTPTPQPPVTPPQPTLGAKVAWFQLQFARSSNVYTLREAPEEMNVARSDVGPERISLSRGEQLFVIYTVREEGLFIYYGGLHIKTGSSGASVGAYFDVPEGYRYAFYEA